MKKIYLLLLALFSVYSFGQNYTFTNYTTSNSAIGFDGVTDIKTEGAGIVWLVSDYNSGANGIAKFDGTTFTNYNTSNSNIPTNMITDLEIDNQNRKWLATYQNGIVLFNGTTWTNYTTSNSGLPSNSVNDIAIDGLNNIWIGTNLGLTKFNGTTWVTYNTTNSNIFSNNVASVAINNANAVYIADGSALSKFNGTTFIIITDGAKNIAKIVGSDLYLNTYSGYAKLVNDDYLAGYQYGNNSCMLDCQLEALDIDENSDVWLGFFSECVSGGLQNFTDCDNYTNLSTNVEGLATIAALKVIDSDTIWIGSYYFGLIKMSRQASSCNPPTQFYTEEITATSAVINWVPPTTAPDYYLYVYNTTNDIGGIDGSTASTSALLEELSPNTDYHWWVASVCGNEQTEWVYGGVFTTLQGTPTNCFEKVAAGRDFTLAIKADGTLWAWGGNAYGQLGDGTTVNKLVPTQIGSSTDWESVAAGFGHSVAIKNNGTLWTWGFNLNGQLGDGTNVNKTVPTQIGTATNWEMVKVKGQHNIALKSNGTLWAWGSNSFSQLGDGTAINRFTPVQIGTGTNWQSIGTGGAHSMAIKTDGTLWCWGFNSNGQLGDGTSTNRFVPTQIGSATNWKSVSGGSYFTIATKTNNSLWTWGRNYNGELGLGNTADKNIPNQVGTATNWDRIAAGEDYALATRTYGALFAWGYDSEGQLGNGSSTESVLTPTLLLNVPSWIEVEAGRSHSVAIDNLGRLYTWGSNSQGQLGNGSTTNDYEVYGFLACPDNNLSISDVNNSDSLKVYPNPIADVLTISYSENITSVSIYTMLGQVISTKIINANEGTIDVSSLQSGTYFVKVLVDNEVKIRKVIKK